MTKKVEKILAVSLAVLGYAAPIGLGIRRVMRGKKGPSVPEAPAKQSQAALPGRPGVEPAALSQEDEQKLESLSLSTPGDAPLDRLARRATSEQLADRQTDYADLKIPAPARPQPTREPDRKSVIAVLNHQSLDSDRLEGWSLPAPERLPIPTYVPAIMAFGIVVFAMGLATTWYVCVAGSLVFAVAAWRWVGELQGE